MNFFYYKDGTTSDVLDSSKILHRLDGPAAIYDTVNCEGFEWYLDGELHREDGPASEGTEPRRRRAILVDPNNLFNYQTFIDGVARVDPLERGKYWYRCGYLHREDGPAIMLDIEKDNEKNWDLHLIYGHIIYNVVAYIDIKEGRDLSYYLSSPIQGEREFSEIILQRKKINGHL